MKNRSRVALPDRVLNLFPNMVRSLRTSLEETKQEAELVVADWTSDDWPLNDWIMLEAGHVPVRVITPPGNFARGVGRNTAGRAAAGDILLFLDADMLVSPALLRRSEETVRQGHSYFPVCWSFDDPGHTRGWWRTTGFGNCALTKLTFDQLAWPVTRLWGGEDVRFHSNVQCLTPVLRERVEGFCHQWHPTDRAFKDRYSAK